jgi:hypothetical protein
VNTVARKLNEQRCEPKSKRRSTTTSAGRRDELVSWVRLHSQASTPEKFMRSQLELRDPLAARQDATRQQIRRLIRNPGSDPGRP